MEPSAHLTPEATLSKPEISHFEPEAAADPIDLFRRWFDDASKTELNDPNAMALATSTPQGLPSVRIVLMKRLDEQGFAFYTNAESQKGRELLENAARRALLPLEVEAPPGSR